MADLRISWRTRVPVVANVGVHGSEQVGTVCPVIPVVVIPDVHRTRQCFDVRRWARLPKCCNKK